MHTSIRSLRLAAALAILALLGACGGGGGDPEVPDVSPVPAFTEPPRPELVGESGSFFAGGEGSVDSAVLLMDASGRFVMRNVLYTGTAGSQAEDVVLGDASLLGDRWTSTGALFTHTASPSAGPVTATVSVAAERIAIPQDGWDVNVTGAPAAAIARRLQFARTQLGFATAPFRVAGSYNGGAITIDGENGRVRGAIAIDCGFGGYASVTDPQVNVARLRVFITGIGCAPAGIPTGVAEFLGYYYVAPGGVIAENAWVFHGHVDNRAWSVSLRRS